VSFLEEVIGRVREYDAARPRSLQAKVGWSEVGGCRSHLAYRLAGTEATDAPDSWGAVRGTAIHALLEEVITGPGILTEVDTEYRGIPGHADVVLTDAKAVWDWKTSRLASIRLWKSSPAVLRQKRIQVHGYAAGLVDTGTLPEDCTVGLVAIPVDGTFADWWAHEEPFDRSLADEGADRLEWVRDRMAAGDALPKDMPLSFCTSWCEFASLCRGAEEQDAAEAITDPELVSAIGAYGNLAQRISGLYKEKDSLADMIRGLRGVAGDWRISLSRPGDPKTVIDEEWVRAEYASRGEDVPEVSVPGAAPRLNVTRVRKAAAK
jgi:hypothetical protein